MLKTLSRSAAALQMILNSSKQPPEDSLVSYRTIFLNIQEILKIIFIFD